jgi:hypothetical protein
MRPESFLKRNWIALSAASISIIGSAAYACMFARVAPHPWYSFCRQIAWIGAPGIMFTAVLTIALQIGISLEAVLLVATSVNFLLYLGLGLALRKLVKALGNSNRG